METENNCTACTPGHYCAQTGLRNVTGLCSSGYWCESKATTDTPSSNGDKFGPFPSGGYYCEEGSSSPRRCPVGRYALPGRNKLKNADECNFCLAGSYCAYGNQTEPTAKCSVGYYCLSGSSVAEPSDGVNGSKCFPGYKCPEGSPYPTSCEAGTYNNESGKGSCLDCPPGFFCTINTTAPAECPSGFYCPIKSQTATANPCPAGTFNNLTARSSPGDCQPCTPGSYCDKPGKHLNAAYVILIIFYGFSISKYIARPDWLASDALHTGRTTGLLAG